jgi:hypothetical protein
MLSVRIAAAVVSSLAAALLVSAAAGATSSLGNLGPANGTTLHTYLGYYDGHKDTYALTDVSSKAQAATMHVNCSPPLAGFKGAPDQYFVQGRAAKGQLAVFGSEPGETSYNPLWEEILVTWKPGVTPVLLVRDDQIDSLAKKGQLTMSDAHVVVNAPITHVGK